MAEKLQGYDLFTKAQEKFKAVLGLRAVHSADLMEILATLEAGGQQAVNQGATRIGYLAEWMVYAGRNALELKEKVQPPLTDEETGMIATKVSTYEGLVPNDQNKAKKKEKATNTRTIETSDAKA